MPKPPIAVSSLDLERLESLLSGPAGASFPGRSQLQAELDRADIMEPKDMSPQVVTMNSTVMFSIQETGKDFRLTLVYPRDAGSTPNAISIFAPVGSALLGLSVGDELAWPVPGGGSMTVRVAEVVYQPERAGELHR
ncbi:MAG: nucleoside diphosphate kinase regulator [Giesbergeria sp.]